MKLKTKLLKNDIKQFFIGVYAIILITLLAYWFFTGFGIYLIAGSFIGEFHPIVGIITLIFNILLILSRYVEKFKNIFYVFFKFLG